MKQAIRLSPLQERVLRVPEAYDLFLGGGRGGVHVHYAMHIAEPDYSAAVQRLRDAGYEVLDHDHSKYGHGRGRAAYVTDPGGHVVELWTWDVAQHLREHERGESPGSH